MKILIIGNESFSMFHFRKDLISSLVSDGHDVTVIVPPGDYVAQIKSLGCAVHNIKFSRFISPLEDLFLLFNIFSFLVKNKFDVVHNITIKPNIYGSIAAYFARVPRIVSLVSGLGYIFQETTSLKKRILLPFVSFLYKAALRFNNKVWFQNPNDIEDFSRRGLVGKDKAVLIYGSGINLEEYTNNKVDKKKVIDTRKTLNIDPEEKIVLMVTARLILTKGVIEFVEAAKKCQDLKGWRFLMISPLDEGTYDGVDVEQFKESIPSNFIWESNFHSDIKIFFDMASIVVLPSKVREGVPRSLIEALAFSKPIVTTDVIGCREVVENDVNGYIVPPGNATELSNAIRMLALDDEKRINFGENSRKLAERKFSHQEVINKVKINLYDLKWKK